MDTIGKKSAVETWSLKADTLDNPIQSNDTVEFVAGTDLSITASETGHTDTLTFDIVSLTQFDTADLTEGTNLYYTDARARAAVSVTDAGGDGSLTYSSATGVITYTGPSASEARAHFSVSDGGADLSSLSYDSGTGVFTYNGVTTSEVRGSVSVTDAGGDGSLTYSSATGVITYTGPSATETRAHFSVSDSGADLSSLSYSSATGVFTYNGVTTAEVRSSVSATSSGELSSLTYSSATGQFSYNGVTNAEVRAAISLTGTAGLGSLTYSSATGVFTYDPVTTAEVRAQVSATDAGGDGSFSYNSTSGVFTYTGPSAAETRAHFSGGTGVTITNGVVAIGQDVGTSSNVSFADLTLSGNLTVNGTTSTINSTNTTVTDSLIELQSGLAAGNTNDIGIVFERGTTGDNGLFIWDESADRFALGTSTATGASSGDLTFTLATLNANLVGAVTGNASTATKWATARTATVTLTGDVTGTAGVSVDGTGNWTNTITTVVGNDTHTHAFNNLTSKTSGTGDYSTSGDLISGRGSGGVALTINDGQGNANVTFNHANGSAEQAGNIGRIEVNTDSTTGAYMGFHIQNNAASGAVTIAEQMQLTPSALVLNSGVTYTGNLTNTLTMNTSGTGISGSATYNNSGAATFTVTSNATNTNTASTIVARDASGNFSAGTITAALSGNASTASTLQTARTINGTSFNGSANITTANWGTSRTHTVTLTGDVTGTAAVSVNGSANWTNTITTTVADNSHNHTSLTGITSLGFAAEGSDSASISTTVSGTNTYFDFNLTDDLSQADQWRWRFTPSGGTLFDAMILDPVSQDNANLLVSGTVTADSYTGNLANTLTMNTSGTGISGSTTFNNSGAATFTVTSNATNANTASTIVARDASGNFSAGTISAALSGNASTATTLQTARTINGTSFNGSANITTANWGTSRTHTVTLTGDVTGTAAVAVNGGSNWTNTITTTVADDSHNHSYSTGDFTVQGGDIFLVSSGTASVSYNSTENSIDFVIV